MSKQIRLALIVQDEAYPEEIIIVMDDVDDAFRAKTDTVPEIKREVWPDWMEVLEHIVNELHLCGVEIDDRRLPDEIQP